MFIFFAKNSQQNVFDDILDILDILVHVVTVQKNNRERQAIPSFHGIHLVEFLSMLLILQFHG